MTSLGPGRSVLAALGCTVFLALGACSRMPSPLVPTLGGSVGLPHQGVLTSPAELAQQGPGYRRIKPLGRQYGTPELVAAIEDAAKRLSEQSPGAPLLVGDLSAQHGGRISGHNSHRSGRDVDLLLFAKDLDGHSIPSPGWVRYGADGLAQCPSCTAKYVQLDVERNWLLVKTLLTSDKANVLWLFVSRPVEALITEYAFARGEDPRLLWKAENVMLQPAHALPHDDHFHLRIACPANSDALGCEDNGPKWPWLTTVPAAPNLPPENEDLSAWLQAD